MKEDLTFSNLKLYNCRKRYYWRNVMKLVSNKLSTPLNIGSGFHKAKEILYATNGDIVEAVKSINEWFDKIMPMTEEEGKEIETNRVIVWAMIEGYYNCYKNDFNSNTKHEAEIKFSIPIINPETGAESKTFNFAGKCDGYMEKDCLGLISRYLGEEKVVSSIDKDFNDKIQLDTQTTGYYFAFQKVRDIKLDGIIFRATRRPSIKQTQKETLEQYRERVILDYKTRPEFYFHEFPIYRNEFDLKEFEQELWDKTQDILSVRRNGWWYKNTSYCSDYGSCQYLPLCLALGNEEKLKEAIEMYMKVEEPNTELRED